MLGSLPVSSLAATVASVTVRITFKNFFSFLLAVAFVIVLGLVSGRLVGITVGRWRAMATALVGTVIGAIGAEAVVQGKHDATIVYALTALFGVLATMVLMIIPEAVGRRRTEGRRRSRRQWLHPFRWVRRTLAPLGRSWEVLGTARRNGLARPQFLTASGITTAEFGRRLRLTLEEVGGMFVKFGQIASTRSDLLAEPVIEELSLSALLGAAHPGRPGPAPPRTRTGPAGGGGVRLLRVRTPRRRVHRPGPPGHPHHR